MWCTCPWCRSLILLLCSCKLDANLFDWRPSNRLPNQTLCSRCKLLFLTCSVIPFILLTKHILEVINELKVFGWRKLYDFWSVWYSFLRFVFMNWIRLNWLAVIWVKSKTYLRAKCIVFFLWFPSNNHWRIKFHSRWIQLCLHVHIWRFLLGVGSLSNTFKTFCSKLILFVIFKYWLVYFWSNIVNFLRWSWCYHRQLMM